MHMCARTRWRRGAGRCIQRLTHVRVRLASSAHLPARPPYARWRTGRAPVALVHMYAHPPALQPLTAASWPLARVTARAPRGPAHASSPSRLAAPSAHVPPAPALRRFIS